MSEDPGKVTYEVEAGVAVVTLDRPATLNALTTAMLSQLSDAFHRADDDDDVRVVILTGAGRGFCAGTDLNNSAALSREAGGRREVTPVMDPARIRKPVIAAVNGPAVGFGLTLAVQCDLMIAASDAKLGFVFVRRGIVGELGTHWLLPRAIGRARAAELLFTGRIFSGDEAFEMGLANRSCAASEVLSSARELAREIEENAAPVSVALTKQLLLAGLDQSRADAARNEAAVLEWVQGEPDAVEGVRSFLERRPPGWALSVGRDLARAPEITP
jgi:enoyl-CoA hydratase/carnithine racemase